jgi:hypothetical protein
VIGNLANLLPQAKGLVVLGKAAIMAHRPELLFGASVVSTVSAAVLGAKGGYEARGIVDAEQERRDKEKLEETQGALVAHRLTTKEKANLTWHCYWPAAAATLAGVGSTTGLHIVHVKEKKQLAAMALLAIDEIKKEAAEEIEKHSGPLNPSQQDKVLEEKAKRNKDGVAKIEDSDGVIEELYLVRDAKTGRDKWSSEQRIEDAALQVNNRIAKDGDCELNEFYSHAGYELTPDGDDYGWSGDFVELRWDTIVKDDGRPVRRFHFKTEPKEGFDSACP